MTLHEIAPAPGALVPTWTVGDRLRKAREMAGIGVEEMATRLGRQRNSIRRWERASVAQLMVIRLYAMETGVDPKWLEHGTTTPNRGGEQAERQSCCTLMFPALRPKVQISVAA